ncbi:MAG: leucine-rich repeat domain-containing protein [Pirellulales bacterium]
MMKQILNTAFFLAILHCTSVFAQETPSRLHLDISGWLRRISKDDQDWKGRREFPYSAFISHASADPKLLEFVTKIGQFTEVPSDVWPGKRCNFLESLMIENTNFNAEQARNLETVWTRKLALSSCEISDEVAKSLGKIRTQELSISNCVLSDDAADSLSGIKCVSIKLENITLSDKAFSVLTRNQELKEIGVELINVPITGRDLENLKVQKDRLIRLILPGSPISDEEFRELPDMPLLRELDLSKTLITGEGLQKFPEMPNLRTLDLSGTKITDVGLQKLPKMTQLEKLNLCGTAITDDGFRNFIVPPTLYEIQASRTKVTMAWGIELSRQHPIRNLNGGLKVIFLDDPRWQPRGGFCERGEFQFYRGR